MGYLTILQTLKILIVLSGDFLTGYFIRNNFEYLLNNFECILNLIELVRKWEMLAATMVKMSNSEKKYMNKNTYNISSIKRVTRKFLEVSGCSHAKQWQRNIEKSVLHVKSCFLLIRPIVVFSPFSLPLPLSITQFYILLEQTINITESFACSPG